MEDLAREDKVLAWRAIQRIKVLMRAEGESAMLFDFLGRARCVLGDLAGSVRAHQKSIALAPQDSMPSFDFAVSLWKLGQHTQAVEVMERSVKLDPDADVATLYLAQWYARLGRGDIALSWIEKSLGCCRGKLHLAWYALILSAVGREQDAYRAASDSIKSFVLESSGSNWSASPEEATEGFQRVMSELISKEDAARLLQILAGTLPLQTKPDEDLQLARLRLLAAQNPVQEIAIPESVDEATDYQEILPYIAESLSGALEDPWPKGKA
jgi:tetratricopeptide (TPR) repeat protein